MIPNRSTRLALLWPLLLAPAVTLAQSAPAAPQSAANIGFDSLWTGWSGVSRDSIRAESEAARSAQQAPSAEGPRSYQAGSVALGERVGEVVRLGDCEEGERIAREAGDFPLVAAVRQHCRPAVQIRSR